MPPTIMFPPPLRDVCVDTPANIVLGFRPRQPLIQDRSEIGPYRPRRAGSLVAAETSNEMWGTALKDGCQDPPCEGHELGLPLSSPCLLLRLGHLAAGFSDEGRHNVLNFRFRVIQTVMPKRVFDILTQSGPDRGRRRGGQSADCLFLELGQPSSSRGVSRRIPRFVP